MQLLFEPFERARLERGNYIDLNVVVHRRSLYEAHGGFDEGLERLVDWELLLRYTAQVPARALPVLAARYRVRDAQRISDIVPAGPSWLAIRKRTDPPALPARAPRVLYVVWHYPQLSESYIEGEIRCLRRWGVEIGVWREVGPVSPYESMVPVFDGDLAACVREFDPDVLHVHWLGYALGRGADLAALGLPVTLRMHGFDVQEAPFRQLLGYDWLHRVYAYPHQLSLLEAPDDRVQALPAAFDTSYFQPAAAKDARLVLRAASCLPSKEIALFFDLAKRLPSHRFVFCGVTCNEWEHYPEELRRMAAEMASPVELRFDVPREQMAELISRAGIFVHTVHPPRTPPGTPIGMPISIAEAMATGAWVLVRDEPELVDYVGDAGAVYRDVAHAAELIEATTQWSESEWQRRRVRASDRGFQYHADEIVFRPILDDWQAVARQRHPAGETESAGVA
jgi:glycosyltransferase involved in cell wall biosynthesis